jgi:polyhydroxyalkanoate synthesis regulator phasin
LFQKLTDTAKDYLDRLMELIQKTALEAAKNMRIAYEKELEMIKFDFERTNRLQLEENMKNIDILEKDIKNIKERIRK